MKGLRWHWAVLTPAGLYSLGLVTLIAADTMVGDGVFLHEVKYHSARGVLENILRDMVLGLPLAYVATIAAVGVGSVLRRIRGYRVWWMPLAGAASGVVAMAWVCIVPSVEVLVPAAGFGAVAGHVCERLSANGQWSLQGVST